MFDPIDQAIYDLVHQFKGGATRLAPLVNMNAGTLSNKANPGMESHHLSVKEAVAIQNTTQDFRILYAEATALNHACVPLGRYDGISDTELLTAYAKYHQAIGEMAKAVSETLADGRITRKEYETVKAEFNKDVQAGLEFLNRMEALIDE